MPETDPKSLLSIGIETLRQIESLLVIAGEILDAPPEPTHQNIANIAHVRNLLSMGRHAAADTAELLRTGQKSIR